ncbi:YihY/virulence factor BrkB family protein [Natronoarchaeum sp. GCM10025703]|uniref:YihY/virulence factor BrkB family protein n=1 Tax=unclassified Natronoarchaeum TaxID=2620183 RepID=UPI00360D613B
MDPQATARSVIDRMSENNVTFLAASIAYYAFFSVVPLLLLTLSVGSLVGGEAFAERIVSLVGDQLSSSGESLVSDALENPDGRTGASIVGLVGLTWSAIKVFRAVDTSFDRIYVSDVTTSLPRQIRNGLTVLLLVGLGIVVMLGVGTFIRRATIVGPLFVDLFGLVALLVGLTIVFLPLYYTMPPTAMTVREALPGTVVATIGWIGLQIGFQIYTTYAASFEAYGILGGVLLFLTWLYFGAILLLLGAVVNAVVADDATETAEAETAAPAE